MRWSIKNSFSKRNYRLLRKKRIIGSNLPKSFLNTIWNWQTREQMKKNFICSKKSVRTFKSRIEPYFLSHAECGESLQNQDFVGGDQNIGRSAPAKFWCDVCIPILGGGGGIRNKNSPKKYGRR